MLSYAHVSKASQHRTIHPVSPVLEVDFIQLEIDPI